MPSHNINTVLKYFDKYKKWVTSNPQLVGDIESTVKWLSYFTAGLYFLFIFIQFFVNPFNQFSFPFPGRINNSTLMSEFVYSLSNLLVLYNDRLITANNQLETELPKRQLKIRIWLTVIEYLEVLFEISANKIFGQRGRWIVIVLLQVSKYTTFH